MKHTILAFLGLVAVHGSVSAKTPESEWANLEHVTWKRPYTFLLRDQTCVRGEIAALSADGITIEGQPAQVHRSDLLRVFEGSDPGNLVYSGRNSWSDIETVHPGEKEYIDVVLKDGSEYHTDPGLTVNGHKLDKAKVLRVYYVRVKPLLENGKTDIEKKYYVYPEVWPRIHHNARMLAVLLYDSGIPEENGPIACNAQ